MLTASKHTLSTIKRLAIPTDVPPIAMVTINGEPAWTNHYVCALLPVPLKYNKFRIEALGELTDTLPDTPANSVDPIRCATNDKTTVVILSDGTIIDARYLALFMNRYVDISLHVHTGERPVVTVTANNKLVGAIAPMDIV